MKIVTCLDVQKKKVSIVGICKNMTCALETMHDSISLNKKDHDKAEVISKTRVVIIDKQLGYLYNSKFQTFVYEIIEYVDIEYVGTNECSKNILS